MLRIRVSDPYSYFTDPDPALQNEYLVVMPDRSALAKSGAGPHHTGTDLDRNPDPAFKINTDPYPDPKGIFSPK